MNNAAGHENKSIMKIISENLKKRSGKMGICSLSFITLVLFVFFGGFLAGKRRKIRSKRDELNKTSPRRIKVSIKMKSCMLVGKNGQPSSEVEKSGLALIIAVVD